MRFHLHLIFLGFLCIAAPLTAQQHYAPDRPGKTIPTGIVPEGSVAFEAGFSWSRADFTPRASERFQTDASIYRHDIWLLPAGLMRIGLGESFELRLSSSYSRWLWEYDPNYFDGDNVDDPWLEGSDPGVTPLHVAIKSALLSERGWIPRAAMVAGLTVPLTGTPAYQVTYLAPDFALTFSHTLSSSVSLGYHIGVRWDGEFVMPIGYYAASLGVALTDDISVFIEAFGDMTGYTPPQHAIDGGIAWNASGDLYFDAAFGLGINDPEETSTNPRWISIYATDYFAEVGASWRMKLW